MKRALLLSVVGLGLALAGCGQSDEEKAKDDVCGARDDIQANVRELQDLTIGTATVDEIKSNLNAIKDDLSEIGDAQGELSESQRQQVQEANETFKSKVQALTDDLGQSLSLEDAGQQLKSDLSELASAYEQALAPIDCG
jgi:predicted  nucleic acid-binding Zn-ribbon protein